MIGIYARVSTEDQARLGYSLADQIRACRAKAGSDEVVEYKDEGITGEILNRPGLMRLLRDIESGAIHKVICLSSDRLSRDAANLLLIVRDIKRKAELVFVNAEYAPTPEGDMFLGITGVVAQYEKAKITERLSRGRREKARQGKVVKDYKIYGYRYDRDSGQLIVDEKEAAIVSLIFRLFTDGSPPVGISGIARNLNAIMAPTKQGGIWHRQVVRQILMNPAYAGTFYQNRWNTEGMLANKYRHPKDRISARVRPRDQWIPVPCPAIVDKETFLRAQDMLEQSRRLWTGPVKGGNLLGGLVRCGLCGSPMPGRTSKVWGRTVREYREPSDHLARACGGRIECAYLDGVVWDKVAEWLSETGDQDVPEALHQAYVEPDSTVRQRIISAAVKGVRVYNDRVEILGF